MSDGAWDCPECGHHNDGNSTCEVCGVARRYYLDPPLDLPFPPRLGELPNVYLGLIWALLAVIGFALLAVPTWAAAVGLGRVFLFLGIGMAAAAAFSSFSAAFWEQRFNSMELSVPATVKTGDPFDATLTVVPYDGVPKVTVRFRLVDNFYERSGDTGIETKSNTLDAQVALLGEPLKGRRTTVLAARFLAPFPATRHSDIRADMNAAVLSLVSVVVPAAGWTARNLKEHGGYYVEATIRIGWMRRTLKRRVIAYALGADLLVG